MVDIVSNAAHLALADRVRECLADADTLGLPLVAAHLDTALTSMDLTDSQNPASLPSLGAVVH